MQLKKISFFLVLILLQFQSVLKGQEDYEKDSLESLLPYANDLQRADILSGLANCIKKIDTARASSYAQQAFTISNKLNYCKGKANALITLGVLEKDRGKWAEARTYYLNGLSFAKSCKEPKSVAFAYHSLGNLYFIKSDFTKALQYYIASVKISEQVGDRARAAKTYNNIASLMVHIGKLKIAEEYYLRSLDFYKGFENSLIIAEIENNLANIYQQKGYDLKALYHYFNALEVFRTKSNAADISSALNNIGLVYLKRKQGHKAMPFLNESYRINIQSKDVKSQLLVISNLITAYSNIKKYDSALYYLRIGLNNNQKNIGNLEIASVYQSASDLYKDLNNKHKQDSFATLYTQAKKEFSGTENNSQVNLAASEFENERKEQKIKIIEKENEINNLKIREQESAIKQRNILLLAAVIILVFLTLIVSLLLYLFQVNKKSKSYEISNRSKSNILNQLNHEIRSPLNGVVGMSQLALESKTFGELKEYLSFIKLGGEELVFILNNLITYLQLDRNEAKPILAPFDLVNGLEELFSIYSLQCKNKGLLFNQMVMPGIPKMVNADKQKVLIMVQNLLSNAVKQTSRGVVKIEVLLLSTKKVGEKKLSIIQFSIIDEGPGLTEKEIKNIFKGTQKRAIVEAGFGIGLKNVKELAELMGGKMEVISEKGKGSNFILKIELEELDANTTEFEFSKSMLVSFSTANFKILIVEDHQDNQFLFSKILEKEGYNYQIAENGLKALALIKENNYDLILMDIQMPAMDGIEAAKMIRNAAEFERDREVPIIAISANDDSLEKKKCFEIGINAYLNKPIKKELLLKTIQNQLNK
jgi:signal transduction histidine kinase/CheY-like chemotaxis protein